MFEEDLKFAESGEEKCWIRLLKSPNTKQVVDVRDDKYFQKLDIDFLQVDIDGNVHKVEVKTDRQAHETGNFVYEIKSNSNEGCLQRSEADYVFYYLIGDESEYVIRMKLLKKYLETHTFKEVKMGDGAVGYLVPLNMLIEKHIAERK